MLISVIVPVYKVEEYLCRCIDSILAQTFTEFELILVDDGSPDNSGLICEEYAKNDNRIRVIHQKNAGLSAARNAGIEWVFANSDSQWLSFVDSDDWIHPRMLQELYDAATRLNLPVSICRFERTDGAQPIVDINQLKVEKWETEDFYINHTVNATVAWGKLYKKDCFLNIRYPLGKIHEDEFTTYKILFSSPFVAVINMPLYAYYTNPDGIMNSEWSVKRLDIMEAYDEQLTFYYENHYNIAYHRRIYVYFWRMKSDLDALLRIQSGVIKDKRKIKRKIKRKMYEIFSNMSKGERIRICNEMYPRLMANYWLIKDGIHTLYKQGIVMLIKKVQKHFKKEM